MSYNQHLCNKYNFPANSPHTTLCWIWRSKHNTADCCAATTVYSLLLHKLNNKTGIVTLFSILFTNKLNLIPNITSCNPVFVGEMRRILNLLVRFVNLRSLSCHCSSERQSFSPCCCLDQMNHTPMTISAIIITAHTDTCKDTQPHTV